MELRHLRYFVAAAEAENVSQAAARLHVSQPALSRQIRDLEEEVGFRLFDRGAKSVRLTEAGRVFLREARELLQQADAAISKARAVANGGNLPLHVGYAPSPTARIIPRALRIFHAQAPGVKVRLHDLSTEEMLAGVREGRLHLAFLVRPPPASLRGLHFQELKRERMCVAVPPDHAWARRPSVTLAQTLQERLVAFGSEHYPEYREYLERLFASAHLRLAIAEEHDSSASLIAALESGAGVAILPESFSCSAGPRLRLLRLSPPLEPIVIGAIWPKAGPSPVSAGFWAAALKAGAALDET